MKKFEVIAEFVDAKTGDRHLPADAGEDTATFTPHDEDQAERLVKAGCLREPKATTAARGSAKPENGESDKA